MSNLQKVFGAQDADWPLVRPFMIKCSCCNHEDKIMTSTIEKALIIARGWGWTGGLDKPLCPQCAGK